MELKWTVDKVIVATANMGKLREIREICQGLPLELSSLKDHWNPLPAILETGSTFAENAAIKARWVFERKETWSLADDSGLEVDFLNGDPGVRSARYAGVNATDGQNLQKLLAALASCPEKKRTGRFRCAIMFKFSEEEELLAEGSCEGRIGHEPKGTGGFGYDPVFIPEGYDLTFAQLEASVKNRISHRAKALISLRRSLDERFGISR